MKALYWIYGSVGVINGTFASFLYLGKHDREFWQAVGLSGLFALLAIAWRPKSE